MNLRWVGILFMGIGVGSSACSDDDADDGGGDGGGGSGGSGSTIEFSCQVEDSGEVIGCDEHHVPGPFTEDPREACTSQGGAVVDACPAANRIGRCSFKMGTLIEHHYEPEDPVEQEGFCTALNGTWTPG